MRLYVFSSLTGATVAQTILLTGATVAQTICSPKSKTFTARINFFEGHLGYFEFDECEGTNPTLGLKLGETYT